MTELDLLIDFHKDGSRQGPGSRNDTLKALSYCNFGNKEIKIADIGCGSGGQTITLAQNTNGHITAVDLFPQFLKLLNKEATAHGFEDRINTLEASMDNLTFTADSFDLIWSEGAIYIMGFEEGIKQWKEFLKPGGYIAVSEITWTTDTRSAEIQAFWDKAYPQIDSAENKIRIMEEQGFAHCGHFILPESSWTENYYSPSEARFQSFLDRHNHSELAKQLIQGEKEEIQMYAKFKEYYSYGFYIGRKR